MWGPPQHRLPLREVEGLIEGGQSESGWVDPMLDGRPEHVSLGIRLSLHPVEAVGTCCVPGRCLDARDQDVCDLEPCPQGAHIHGERVSASSLGGLYTLTLLLRRPAEAVEP